jgi:predicted transcriptional regulator
MLRRILEVYAGDAEALPLEALKLLFAQGKRSPVSVARQTGVPLWVAMRRLSHLPLDMLGEDAGLIVIDAAGTLLYRKPIGGFRLPRYGTGCALWPIYQVQGQAYKTISSVVKDAGNLEQEFTCLSTCEPKPTSDPFAPILTQSYMYITPKAVRAQTGAPQETPLVGGACRVCPVKACKSRTEPSILLQEF